MLNSFNDGLVYWNFVHSLNEQQITHTLNLKHQQVKWINKSVLKFIYIPMPKNPRTTVTVRFANW